MTANLVTATNEILAAFKDAWEVQSPVPEVRWPGIEKPALPNGNASWARVSIRHRDSRQGSLAGANATRRWTRNGLVFVQVFAPMSEGLGLSSAQQMAMIAQSAFEGKATPSGVWFRNVAIKEIGPDGSWYQMNVVAEFTYDEIK